MRRFWIVVVATGAAAGVGAALLVRLLRAIQALVWPPGAGFLEAVQHATPLRRFVALLAAGVVVSAAAALARRRLGGHGTAGILEAIWVRAGRLSLLWAFLRGVLTIVVVAMGAPLGREGALLQVGSATGSWLGDRFRIHPDQRRLLVACGAAAGLAAAYNVPIGGALFGLEVLLGSLALDLFGPIVVACVTGTLVSRILVADHPSYQIPHYVLSGPYELLFYLAMGPVLGVASAMYVRGIEWFAGLADRVPERLAPVLPILGLAAVGLLAIPFPQVLGNGYGTVDAALLGGVPLTLLVILPLLKLCATGVAAGSGVPGGLFTPSLFFGALLGGALGHLAQWIAPGSAPPGAYALVGMGAVLAGSTHASVSAVLIIFELTGNYGVILPLMLACILATVVSRRLEPHSLYSAALARRKVNVPEPHRPHWLRGVRIGALIVPAITLPPSAPFRTVVDKLLDLPAGGDLYVTGPETRYLGTIALERLKAHLPEGALLQAVVAADVMEVIEPLPATLSVGEAAARFTETTLDKLPVVHPGTGELLGAVSKSEILRLGRF